MFLRFPHLFIAGCMVLFLGLSACRQEGSAPLATYANGRFGFCVSYPPSQLTPMGESENGDGQSFVSLDRQMTVRVFGYHDIGESLAAEMTQRIEWWENDDPEMEVTQQVSTDTTYLISGSRNGFQFDQRVLHRTGMFWFIEREYSEEVDDKVFLASSKMLEAFPTCP